MTGHRRRRVLVGLAAAATAVLAWPAVDPSPSDGLPVSNYPMFARDRARVSSFPLVELVAPDGSVRRLSVREISGTDQPMQAAMTITQAIGTGTAGEFCAELAATLATPGRVEVVTARYDAIAWFEGDREPLSRDVHAACVVDQP